MDYKVLSRLENGDYRIGNLDSFKIITVDLFVDDSCEFDSKEDIIGKIISIEEIVPCVFFAKNVKLNNQCTTSVNRI